MRMSGCVRVDACVRVDVLAGWHRYIASGFDQGACVHAAVMGWGSATACCGICVCGFCTAMAVPSAMLSGVSALMSCRPFLC